MTQTFETPTHNKHFQLESQEEKLKEREKTLVKHLSFVAHEQS